MMERIELPNERKIRTLDEKKTYKYLGILEADTIKEKEKKEKNEYLRIKRKLLEIKLHCRNLTKCINTWAVPFVRNSGPFLKRMRELHQMDQRTRKLMMMHESLLSGNDVDRLYALRKEVGKRIC